MTKTNEKPARNPQKKPSVAAKSPKKTAAKAVKPAEKINPLIATLADIADEHSVEKRTINIWVTKHGCPREDRGRYDRKKVNAWLKMRHDAELELAQVGGEDEKQARARLIRSQADMVEHKLGQLRGEFIKVSDATFILSNAAVKANFEFDEIPKTAAIKAVNMDSVEEIETLLKELINGAKINVVGLGEQAHAFAKRYSSDILLPEILDAEGDLDNLAVGGKKSHAAHRTVRKQGRVEKHNPPTVHL